MGKTLSELIEKTSANDSDVILIEDSTSTNKITKANFLKDLVNKTDILSDRVEAVEKLKEGSELEVTTESGYVVCENAHNGQIEGLKVEGRTLVNLCSKDESKLSSPYKNITSNLGMIKPNTYYTVVFNIKSWTKSTDTNRIHLGTTGSTKTNTVFDGKEAVHSATGIYIYLWKSNSDLSLATRIFGIAYSHASDTVDIELILLEGDHTQNPPPYFEGLKSVGDGVDKIEVLSHNQGFVETDKLYQGTYDTSKSPIINVSSSSRVALKVDNPIKGDKVFIKSPYDVCFIELDSNKNVLLDTGWLGTSIKEYTAKMEDCEYIAVVFKKTDNSALTISEVINSKTIIANIQNKKQILFKNSTGTYEKPVLRSTGTVSDTIEKHSDGKYYFHRRCGEVVLNGSESWLDDANTTPNSKDYLAFYFNNIEPKLNSSVLMNTFRYIPIDTYKTDKESEGCSCGIYIGIRLQKTKLNTANTEGFKTWLSKNPTTVVYELATEEVFECVNLDLDSYEGETSVIFDGGAISPKISFKIASHIANTVQVLKDRINYLEDKVINMFKAVLSGDVQTLAYELYPEDFEIKTDETVEGTELL